MADRNYSYREDSSLKIMIQESIGNFSVNVWFYRKNIADKFEVMSINKDGLPVFTEQKEAFTIPIPTFAIPIPMWNSFKNAILAEMPNPNIGVFEAELKATKYHLEDMRKLVFKRENEDKKNLPTQED